MLKFPAMPPRIWSRRNGSSASEFLVLLAQLREAQFALEAAGGGLETQFLATSSNLEALSGSGDTFVKRVEKLIGLATGKDCDGSVFANAVELIEQSTHFLTQCQDETGRMLDSLQGYNRQIKHLLAVEAELQRTMLPLKYVQTLFKEESAPLGPAIQQMFGALTQEIEGLHAQVQDVFGTKFKQLEQTHRTIGQVIVQLDQQVESLRQVTTTHKARIESSLETLKKEMACNQERDVRLDRLSKDLAREVGQIVMGLQFHDIVSQKLQHVSAALPQIEAKFAEFQAAPNPGAASGALQFLHQSCRLEAGQVDAARTELANAESTIRGGIQKVLAHLTEMDARCLSLEEFKLLTTSFDGMVQVLLEMIEEVRRLVAATVAGAAKAYELLRPLGSLASDLTAVVRSMSVRIHLIGLNAQIQAARTTLDRRGAGLEVLSARTSEISDETNRISLQAAEQLDAIAAGLAQSVKALGQLGADGQVQRTLLNQQGGTEEQRLHGIRDSALRALREIGDSLDAIRDQANHTLGTLQLAGFHEVTLPGLRTPLVALADAAERWLHAHGRDTAQGNVIEGLKRDYTMESEREVFAKVTSGNAALCPQVAGAPAGSPDVEFFTEAPAGKEGQTEAAAGPKEEKVLVPAVAAPAGGSDLGANVDLF